MNQTNVNYESNDVLEISDLEAIEAHIDSLEDNLAKKAYVRDELKTLLKRVEREIQELEHSIEDAKWERDKLV